MKKTILILTLILLSCQFSFSQNNRLTAEEKKAAKEIADVFTRKMEETGDVNSTFNDLFVKDFFERFIKDENKGVIGKGAGHSYFIPGIEYNPKLASLMSINDWRKFYTSTFNIIFYGGTVSLNKWAKYFLEKKAPPDELSKDFYPPAVVKLLDENPNLRSLSSKSNGAAKPIKNIAELRNANNTLEKSVRLLIGIKGERSAKINEAHKLLIEKLSEMEEFKAGIETEEEERFGFPAGTRFISIQPDGFYRLVIVRIDGKYKIIMAEPYSSD